MFDLNRVQIIGRLVDVAEIRTTTTNKKVATFRVACTMFKDQQGNDKVEYISCTAWEKLADVIEKYTNKGTLVYLEGPLQTTFTEDQQGKKTYYTKVLVNQFRILSQPKNAQTNNSDGNSHNQSTKPKPTQEDQYDDLPEINLDEIVTPF